MSTVADLTRGRTARKPLSGSDCDIEPITTLFLLSLLSHSNHARRAPLPRAVAVPASQCCGPRFSRAEISGKRQVQNLNEVSEVIPRNIDFAPFAQDDT